MISIVNAGGESSAKEARLEENPNALKDDRSILVDLLHQTGFTVMKADISNILREDQAQFMKSLIEKMKCVLDTQLGKYFKVNFHG